MCVVLTWPRPHLCTKFIKFPHRSTHSLLVHAQTFMLGMLAGLRGWFRTEQPRLRNTLGAGLGIGCLFLRCMGRWALSRVGDRARLRTFKDASFLTCTCSQGRIGTHVCKCRREAV